MIPLERGAEQRPGQPAPPIPPAPPAPPLADPRDARVWEEDFEVASPDYRVDDVPPFFETLLYAFQHTLVDVSPYVLPLVVAGAVGYSAAQAAAMVSACLVCMGLATFANATWGNRLPSVLGPSATDTGAMASAGAIFGAPAMWMAGLVGGLMEIAIGASGVLARLRRFLPPYVCGIIVLTIGVTLARVAGGWLFIDPRPRMLGLAGATVLAVLILNVIGARGRRFGLGILARGSILFGLLLGGVAGASLLGLADFAALGRVPWLGLPRLFAFGGPGLGWELAAGAVAGVAIGYLGSIAESIGDYAATCAVVGVAYRVRHMNRGITVEGIASAVGPLFGALPLTTYAQNIGVIATTRVASRRVVQVAAGLLLLYGLSPKLGALVVLIPRPVVGAVFLMICGMIAVTGLRLLGSAPKDDAAYLTTALTLAASLTLPLFASAKAPWFAALPPLARLMLSNGVVLAISLGVGLNATLGAMLRSGGKDAVPS
ncbi:MAG TPA: solute carrier family 23 protein [Thermoanaerobaculia bacterium]|nr:solute carrier family 23 protein [Thermoanaerobaculia bacterium]